MTALTFKILPDGDAPSSPSRLIPKACFTTTETDESSIPFYDAGDGSVSAGIWECAPCKLEILAYPVNEMMTIISGALTITSSVKKWRSMGLCVVPGDWTDDGGDACQ